VSGMYDIFQLHEKNDVIAEMSEANILWIVTN